MEIEGVVYRVYGLKVRSDLPLPELPLGEGPADVVIRYGQIARLPNPNGAERQLCATPEGAYLHWQNVATFLVRQGHEVVIAPEAGTEESILRLAVLGPVLGVLLHQRGASVFHASAVACPFGAVAFFARKGQGKSTMAAALQNVGYGFITDDILAVDENGDSLVVSPGFPQNKLWPDSVKALGEKPEDLPMLGPKFEKRARQVSQEFVCTALPLQAVFVLDFADSLEISRLHPKAALLEIMPHWYGALFQGELLHMFGLAAQLRQCTNLVNKIPIYALKRPRSLAALSCVALTVEEFFVGGLHLAVSK